MRRLRFTAPPGTSEATHQGGASPARPRGPGRARPQRTAAVARQAAASSAAGIRPRARAAPPSGPAPTPPAGASVSRPLPPLRLFFPLAEPRLDVGRIDRSQQYAGQQPQAVARLG